MNINPELMWEFFNKNPLQHNLQKGDIVYLPPARFSCYGINFLAFRGSLLWNSLPSNVKQSHNLEELKLKLRNLGNIHCRCVNFILLSLLCFFISNLYYVFYILNFWQSVFLSVLRFILPNVK